ncbi:hypothetical protein FGM00_19625 [Aggregatimonas sangjinii]|uniref:Uncharacterized protein n=1 Tax=Aggregatimonas sangjinii TaxID=2583587 RepID=A0A5B7SYR1_9FLAO|nr:DUF5995 family protein [Aggregatimonas sangjinii]QCX02218.1 hypothetical protein FGM00_19625 [Aggregatimonas sangjinii]
MSRATTIQEVLKQLDTIIADAIAKNNRLGLFAYVYRRTTAEILQEVQSGSFEDNELLEELDVAFANLYLDAYRNYQHKEPICKSWEFAFVNKEEPLSILQHILMGMNAHINLDLAIATGQVMRGKDIVSIQNDFDKVNDILFGIVNEMQDKLSRVSRLMFLLDIVGKNSDEKIIDFSMRKARQQSWNNANLLWGLGPEHQELAMQTIDGAVLKISKFIKSPRSRIIRFVLRMIRKFEDKNVGGIISKLRAVP